MCSARRLMVFNVCVKFHENMSNSFKVMERTRKLLTDTHTQTHTHREKRRKHYTPIAYFVCRGYNEKVCCAQELGSYAQGQGHNQVKGQIVPKTTEANLMKLHRQIKHNLTKLQRKHNLTKLHRKIEHNEKVCRTQGGSYAQG